MLVCVELMYQYGLALETKAAVRSVSREFWTEQAEGL